MLAMKQNRTPSLNQPAVPKETEAGRLGFMMSSAKEDMIVEHSEDTWMNASKEAGNNGSGDANGTSGVGAPVNALLIKGQNAISHSLSNGDSTGCVSDS